MLIKINNKYVTAKNFNYTLTENENFAYDFDTIEEAQQVAKIMQLNVYEIVK